MNRAIKCGRIFYAVALIVYGVQQFIYGDFRGVFLPPWQYSLPFVSLWAYLFGFGLLAAAFSIIANKQAGKTFLAMGITFLCFFTFVHVPYELISEPNRTYHLGVWANALKELAFAGGAFIMAGTYARNPGRRWVIPNKLISAGNLFYLTTIILFGVAHIMYPSLAGQVPNWFADQVFWNYFAAVALIGSGTFIVLNTRRRLIASLQALMLFLWFLLVHAPSAIHHLNSGRGNLLASAFDALMFSGVSLVIASYPRYQFGDDI